MHDGTRRGGRHYEGRKEGVAGAAHVVEEFARDCVRLAEQADTPELRAKLLNLAREWMRAVMVDEDHALRTGR